jgi:predicted DNA-binding transcriptional regulator AlpA
MSFLKNRDQLAQEYGVSRPTFYRMLERAGLILPARVQLSPIEVEKVYEKLGRPLSESKNNTNLRAEGKT